MAVSCRIKAEIVARDEFETGERQLLNLGHTFGHALEADTGFSDRLLHGEAVAAGEAREQALEQANRQAASMQKFNVGGEIALPMMAVNGLGGAGFIHLCKFDLLSSCACGEQHRVAT